MQDVRVCLDQNMTSDALIEAEDSDTLSLDEIIRSKVPEAVLRVHVEAPVHLLECGHNMDGAICWDEGDCVSGWIPLPDDFLRLVVFSMDDWDCAVYTAISADSPLYAMQRSRFRGIRGTPQKPVCALGIRPEGRVLEFYSCRSRDAKVSRAVYIPCPEIDADGYVDCSERCYNAIVYAAAALTLQSCGESEKASVFSNLANTFLK